MSTQPQKVPLIASTNSRDSTALLDARVMNAYVEKLETGDFAVIKRPGITTLYTLTPSGAGFSYWNGDIYAVSNWTLYKNGLSLGAIGSLGGTYTFDSARGATSRLFFHNGLNAYYYSTAEGPNFITALNGPTWVPGSVYLDATMYVMDTANNVRGSGINDLTTWNALNTIAAQMEPSGASYLFKQLQYAVALKQASMEAFWDAGNPTGSPLQSAKGNYIPYGCRTSGSFQSTEDTAFWVTAMAPKGGMYVVKLTNMQLTVISTPAIERLLQKGDFSLVYSWTLHISGHRFYGLTLKNNNITVVYDDTSGEWFQWTDTNGNYLPWIASTTSQTNQNLIQHENGSIYTVDAEHYMDDGSPIPVDIYTPLWDGGTQFKKYLPRMNIHSDNNGLGRVKIRWTDDDYKTWSNYRDVNLALPNPELRDCGTFRKRAWHIRHSDNTPFRIKSLELHLMLGTT